MESFGETIGSLFSELMDVWIEILSKIWEVIPKIFYFLLWALSALIILPCVFVASHLYPKWEEWGGDF